MLATLLESVATLVVSMAKSNAEICAEYRKRQAEQMTKLGLVEVKMPLAKVTRTQLNKAAKRHGFQGVVELIQTFAAYLEHKGDDVPAEMLRMPYSYQPSAAALQAQQEFNAQFGALSDDE